MMGFRGGWSANQGHTWRPGFYLSICSAINGVYFISRQIFTDVVVSCQPSWLYMKRGAVASLRLRTYSLGASCKSPLLSQEGSCQSTCSRKKCRGQHPEMVNGERGILKRIGALLRRKMGRQANNTHSSHFILMLLFWCLLCHKVFELKLFFYVAMWDVFLFFWIVRLLF